MNKYNSGLKIPSPSPSTSLKAEILWGCEEGGSSHFPRNMDAICVRKESGHPKPMDAFSCSVMNAVDRVWIVDQYFFVPDRKNVCSKDVVKRIKTILEWLHLGIVANDIRILTGEHCEINEDMLAYFQDQEQKINDHNRRREKQCSIQINTNLRKYFDYIHDRFAIVDNELWHFGATVGGFHPKVNAASRGWNATETGAIEFFELAWKICDSRRNKS